MPWQATLSADPCRGDERTCTAWIRTTAFVVGRQLCRPISDIRRHEARIWHAATRKTSLGHSKARTDGKLAVTLAVTLQGPRPPGLLALPPSPPSVSGLLTLPPSLADIIINTSFPLAPTLHIHPYCRLHETCEGRTIPRLTFFFSFFLLSARKIAMFRDRRPINWWSSYAPLKPHAMSKKNKPLSNPSPGRDRDDADCSSRP